MIYLIVIFPMVVSNYWYVKIWSSPNSLRILEMAFALKKTEAAHWKDYTTRNQNYVNSQSSEQDPKKRIKSYRQPSCRTSLHLYEPLIWIPRSPSLLLIGGYPGHNVGLNIVFDWLGIGSPVEGEYTFPPSLLHNAAAEGGFGWGVETSHVRSQKIWSIKKELIR